MADVAAVLHAVERLLAAHVDELDRLNVYPVPDEDTGRNLLATVRAAVADPQDPGEAATRGARGNSGVLLSQFLVALLPSLSVGRPAAIADGLRAGALAARGALAVPVAGSLLDAADAAADAAGRAVDDGADTPVLLELVATAAHAAVEATTARLPALTRADVVDAGARGLALVLEAIAAQIAGRRAAPPRLQRIDPLFEDGHLPHADAAFELMATVRIPASANDPLRDGLGEVAASVQVAPISDGVLVHVHADDVADAVAVLLHHGEPHDLRLVDLRGLAATVLVLEVPDGLRQLVVDAGATTLLPPGTPEAVRLEMLRGLPAEALLLPGTAAGRVDRTTTTATVVSTASDGPRALAALAVAVDGPPAEVIRAALEDVTVVPVGRDGSGRLIVDGTSHDDAVDAVCSAVAGVAEYGRPTELVQVHVAAGETFDIATLRAGIAARLPDSLVEVHAAGHGAPALLVAVE